MECEVCKKREATYHVTQIVDNDMRKVDLCEGCAKEKGVSDPMGFALGGFLQEAAKLAATGEPAEERKEPRDGKGLQCARCGMGQAEFKKTGRLGCSDCYATFGEMLDGVLKGMHKGIRHVGKVRGGAALLAPAALAPLTAIAPASAPLPGPTVEEMAAELAAAVAREDFEAAARLRDAIRATKAAGPGAKGGKE
jgi:protein arginine kinase activator